MPGRSRVGDVLGPAAGLADHLRREVAVGRVADGQRAGDRVADAAARSCPSPCLTAVRDRVAAGRLRAEEAAPAGFDQAERDELLERLVDLADQAAAGHRADDVVGQTPAELLGDLVADRLRALGVVRPQIDVDEAPAVLEGDLRAEAIDVVVVAVDAHEPRAVDLRAENLGRLQIGRARRCRP